MGVELGAAEHRCGGCVAGAVDAVVVAVDAVGVGGGLPVVGVGAEPVERLGAGVADQCAFDGGEQVADAWVRR